MDHLIQRYDQRFAQHQLTRASYSSTTSEMHLFNLGCRTWLSHTLTCFKRHNTVRKASISRLNRNVWLKRIEMILMKNWSHWTRFWGSISQIGVDLCAFCCYRSRAYYIFTRLICITFYKPTFNKHQTNKMFLADKVVIGYYICHCKIARCSPTPWLAI